MNNEMINIASKLLNESLYNIDSSKDIVIIYKNNNGEIVNLKYNDILINNILNNITDNLLTNINKINDKNNYYFVPIEVNYLLSLLQIKIPIKINFNASTQTSIETNIKEYGINNSLLQINIRVDFNILVIYPFYSDKINITKSVPISTNVIEGIIPEYYGGSLNYSSKIY